MEYGYLWPLNKDMDVFVQNLKSRNITPLQASPAYDAEGTISADGIEILNELCRQGWYCFFSMCRVDFRQAHYLHERSRWRS